MSLAALRKNRKGGVEKLAKQVESMNSGGFKKDERILPLTRDKDGNAYKVVRFLPTPAQDFERFEADGKEAADFVRVFEHSFQGPGGWYIEKSLTTIEKDDPLSELNSAEWDENDQAAKDRVSKRSRKQQYYLNVYVVTDKENPTNEGKVMLLKCGKQLYTEIMKPTKPKFPTDPTFDPFDFYEGADFAICVFTEEKGKNKFPNYTESKFLPQAPFMNGDDAQIEKVYNQAHSLYDFIDPKTFKSYEELEKKLCKVMKIDSVAAAVGAAEDVDLEESAGAAGGFAPTPQEPVQQQQSAPVQQEPVQQQQQEPAPSSDADDPLAMFKALSQS